MMPMVRMTPDGVVVAALLWLGLGLLIAVILGISAFSGDD